MKTVLVIDGNSMVSRAFYGMTSHMSTQEGQPTGAIYGFFTMLHKLLKVYDPEGLCVTFDRKGPTFRHEKFADYKTGRNPMPEELVSQLPILRDVLDAMKIPYYSVQSWEADDLMGTIARLAEGEDWYTVIASGDGDTLQLITGKTHVHWMKTKEAKLYTEDLFQAEYGFDPIHLIDLKAIMGDTSDKIPGIKGMGVKTVTPLIQNYHSIEKIFEALEDPEETLGLGKAALKKMREGKEMAELCYDLARIRCDAPLEDFSMEKVERGGRDDRGLYQLLSDLELKKLITLYEVPEVEIEESAVVGTCTVEVVETLAQGEALLEKWLGKFLTVLPVTGESGISGLGLFEKESGIFAVCVEGKMDGFGQFLPLLFDASLALCVFECKELEYLLLKEGISSRNIVFDVALAGYLLSPDDKEYTLEGMGKKYLGYTPRSAQLYTEPSCFSPLGDWGESLEVFSSHGMLVYALWEKFRDMLEETRMDTLFQEIELPLCKVLGQMQVDGIAVSRKSLTAYGEKLLRRCEELERLIHQEAGEEFNVSSPQQLGVILFEKMELPTGKKTKKGYSTNVEVLEDLRAQFPEKKILSYLLEYRHVSKLHSTYAKGLQKEIGADGKIHSVFKNTVTGTGRLSSTEPNLQNIPIRTELGQELRYMFVAEEGCVLIDADYSQIELRLLAHLSDDDGMVEAFLSGEDFHTRTASQVFGVPVEQVDSEMRRSAKAVNFGIIYGMGGYSLAQDIGVSVAEANQYITRYFRTYPEVEKFMTNVVKEARESGSVRTLYGRRRWVSDVQSSNAVIRKSGERVAQNMPMQGTAADIMKKAMVEVSALLTSYPEAKLLLQIHDEVIVQCPEAQGAELCEKLRAVMEGVASLRVPLLVEAQCGKSWGDAH